MVKTVPFDAARYTTSPERQQSLLDDAFASGNAACIARALGISARARGMTDVAREAGVTREALARPWRFSVSVNLALTSMCRVRAGADHEYDDPDDSGR